MENERYMREGLNLKKLLIRFMDRLWVIAAAVLAGALLGAAIYLLAHLVFAPEREYQSVSKVYLNFNCEPEHFNELSYNGYTWNDLMVTDPILNYTMEELPTEVSRETVIAATKAEILSDIRLLTVTITSKRPELTAQIMSATQAALLNLGNTDELFHSIEIYSTTGPEQIIWDNRTVNAAATGAVLAFFLSAIALFLYFVLDDSLYVEEDVERKYGLPSIGIFTEGEPGTFQSYSNEFLANYKYLCRGRKDIGLLSVDCFGDAEKSRQTIEKIISMARPGEEHRNIPLEMAEDSPDVYEEIRKMDGVILVARYGRGNGRLIERGLSTLKKQDCKVLGILIVEANTWFLKRYYMCKRRKRKIEEEEA